MSTPSDAEPRSSLDELRVPRDPAYGEPTLDDTGASAESTGSVPWSPTGAQARTALLARIAAPTDPEITQVPRPEAMLDLRARVLGEPPEVLPAARGPLAPDRRFGPYDPPSWRLSADEATQLGERTGSLVASPDITGELETDRDIPLLAPIGALHVRGRRRLVLLAAAVVGLLLLGALTRACGLRTMPASAASAVPVVPTNDAPDGD